MGRSPQDLLNLEAQRALLLQAKLEDRARIRKRKR